MQKIGVMLVHGSGWYHQDRLEDFEKGILALIAKKGGDTTQLEFEIVDWHPAIQDNQNQLWEKYLQSGIRLGSKKLRRFVLYNMSDNFAYNILHGQNNPVYKEIHKQIHESILSLKNKVGEGAPVIVICSSMGTSVMYNYIYDRQYPGLADPFGQSSFERLENLTGFITMGSTIPIYLAAYNESSYKCLDFPSKNIVSKYKDVAEWHDYYDAQDVLGYPLKPLSDKYGEMVKIEEKVKIGGLFSFWNVGSHMWYWKSRKIRKSIANYLMKIMTVVN